MYIYVIFQQYKNTMMSLKIYGIPILVGLYFLTSGFAQAGSVFVSSNGNGSDCTNDKPCSLNTGLDRARHGDELVLQDGKYVQKIQTRNSGVVIRAQNKHLARIVNPDQSDRHGNNVINIHHDKVTLRHLIVDNQDRGGVGIEISGNDFLIEHNIITNTGSSGIYMIGRSRGGIIRFNLIKEIGNTPRNDSVGKEGLNLGGYTGDFPSPTGNTEIYGNVVRDAIWHALEHKENSFGFNVHHNIFENARSSVGELFWILGRDNKFHNNIIRNSKKVTGTFGVSDFGNDIVSNNVIYNVETNRALILRPNRGKFSRTSDSKFINNTLCNTGSRIEGGNGLVVNDNQFNAPQSACDAEEQRILNEMKRLPGSDAAKALLSSPINLRALHIAR